MAIRTLSFPLSGYTSPEEAPRCRDAASRSPCDGNAPGSTTVSSHDVKRGSRSCPPSAERRGTLIHRELSQTTNASGLGDHERLLDLGADHREETRSRHEPETGCDRAMITLPLRLAKRARASHDVDGPDTDKLPMKKRRLLLHLITSRLSRPFSLPATHILIRESGDTMPVLHRIQQLASFGGSGAGPGLGGARRAGHQSTLIRKAAILNRIRICVRQAAIARGHAIMTELAARGTALNHGLQVVTTGGRFPSTGADGRLSFDSGEHGDAVHRQSHVASSHSNRPYEGGSHGGDTAGKFDERESACGTHGHIDHTGSPSNTKKVENIGNEPTPALASVPSTVTDASPAILVVPPSIPAVSAAIPVVSIAVPVMSPADADDEEDNTAFPAASFQDRYADLSDDDMGDVYADFGVLFGSSGSRSPEGRSGSPGPVEEQFFEEYLDELDGIPWVV
ncbi:hypothetical protein GGR50DRAFT_343417 [Xylaria sp. CBS 124048]|nr:hypothetical protein GGR50DRAFT_343417 [Xylaria sp. CBS 124048]